MKKGFTLIELIMIIVVLGILAAVAVPKYFDLQIQAKQSAEKGVVGGVRAGIYTYFANYTTYPATLDSAAASSSCNSTNICFSTVLQQGGITSDWNKTSNTVYVGPTGTSYTYNVTSGDFK